MRVIISLLVLVFTCGFASADLFQYENPFPSETNAYGLNNIYKVSPEALSKEKQANEKVTKSRWWKSDEEIKKDSNIHEGIQSESLYQRGVRAEDSGFIMFK